MHLSGIMPANKRALARRSVLHSCNIGLCIRECRSRSNCQQESDVRLPTPTWFRPQALVDTAPSTSLRGGVPRHFMSGTDDAAIPVPGAGSIHRLIPHGVLRASATIGRGCVAICLAEVRLPHFRGLPPRKFAIGSLRLGLLSSGEANVFTQKIATRFRASQRRAREEVCRRWWYCRYTCR
jgi:hypothetical protein